MDRFDYKLTQDENYLSSGIFDGDVPKPVAWGSTSSFTNPITVRVGRGLVQLIVEPALDDVVVLNFGSVEIRYLQNGVYSVNSGEDKTRVVANTGPISIKLIATDTEAYIVLDGVPINSKATFPAEFDFTVSPTEGVMYDKIILGYTGSIDELVRKEISRVGSGNGVLSPLSNDRWYEPKLLTVDDMFIAEDYRVACRQLALTNTAVAFYSDTTKIEKSNDAETWEPVDKVEYHGEYAPVYRSKDPSFALRFYDTNIKEFIVGGATTTVTGQIYKVGNDIGSFFSHDCYRIHEGSLKVEAEGLTSVTIMGYIPDALVASLNPVIDFGGTNYGKMHVYTFNRTTALELVAEEIFVAAIGVNLNHNDLMKTLVGVSEISYADEIPQLQVGQSINGDNEYSILDLQWSI